MFNEDLKTLVNNAIAKGACKYATNTISKYSTIEEALTHKFASYWVYWYIVNVLDGVAEDTAAVEEYVLKYKPIDIYRYIFLVKKERWEAGEAIIKTSPYCSCFYAIHVMKNRWQEQEALIKKDINLWNYDYAKAFDLPPIKVSKNL
jgi:hypothetical protein